VKFTDTSEKGLETLIVEYLVDENGYRKGESKDFFSESAVDLKKLTEFLQSTQPDIAEKLCLKNDCPNRTKFLYRLQGEIEKRGVIEVLRKGIKHESFHIDLFYGQPSPDNLKAVALYQKNIFSVTRQLHFSNSETQLSLDMAIFINGLPIATFELKNRLTKQTVADAVQQYKNDRDPKELLFHFGRCIVHFALDEHEIKMCTHLKGKASWFLPFNKGHNDGAGNPPNPAGLNTAYLWKEVLTKDRLTEIIENYAQIVVEKSEKTGRKTRKQIFPRYHQINVVRKLLKDVKAAGAGKRYLVQHSAGSGKSNSIAWLAHQLIGLEKDNENIFDSIIVITDRRVLDRQIRDTIKQFAQVSSVVGHAEKSSGLKEFIQDGKKIIISTVQKFPFIMSEIGDVHRNKKFAIIIDEAHSSQGGKTSAALNMALADKTENYSSDWDELDLEDKINKVMESKKMITNASYFAFTATPKNKTLEIFGEPNPQPDGKVKHEPFHSYTMKQAIQEGFILDVLESYTPIKSYYKLAKKVEGDPEFDTKKAKKKLRKYVEGHDYAIKEKAEIMIKHFHEQVISRRKIGGKARAMVITSSILRAIDYFNAFNDILDKKKYPYRPIVAFSGSKKVGGKDLTEASLNGFSSNQIKEKIVEDPYRFLIVADKFQTGYDQPLLHTMYVDKPLEGIKAVQTLSRLNRAHPQKRDTFVLDFYNDSEVIKTAFENYYRTTILSEETDPNKLHDLKSDLDNAQIYNEEQIDSLVEKYINGASRDEFEINLTTSVGAYSDELDEDQQVDFKGKAKAFVRTYGFLSSILPYNNSKWEKLSIFLGFLIPKLPAPEDKDLSKGILDSIDMDSYRAEVKEAIKISLTDEDAEIGPVPTTGGGGKPEPDMDRLSNIVKTFNDLFGNIQWKDGDKIKKVVTEEIPQKVADDKAYQNAIKNSDKQNARIEHDKALQRVMIELLSDHTELFKQFSDNPSFKKWLSDTNFNLTYQKRNENRASA
jgi:type I restriction enzyme R subunit